MAALTKDLVDLLDGTNIAHIATLLDDGSPHSVPIWVGREGDRLAFLTGPDARKARNVARDPRVAISLVDAANPAVMAQVRGRVVETVEGEAGWAIIDRLAHKYTGGPYPLRSNRAAFLVEADHVLTLDFSDGPAE